MARENLVSEDAVQRRIQERIQNMTDHFKQGSGIKAKLHPVHRRGTRYSVRAWGSPRPPK